MGRALFCTATGWSRSVTLTRRLTRAWPPPTAESKFERELEPMRTAIAFAVLSLALLARAEPFTGPSVDFSHGPLRVSDNHRFLVPASVRVPFRICFPPSA